MDDWTKDNTEETQEFNRLMSLWQTRGVADEEIAKGLGVPVGATTESYYFNKAAQEMEQEQWNKANEDPYKDAKEDLIKTAQTIIGGGWDSEEDINDDDKAGPTLYTKAAETILAQAGLYGIGVSEYYDICEAAGISRHIAQSVLSDNLASMSGSEDEDNSSPVAYYASLMSQAEDKAAWLEENKFKIIAENGDAGVKIIEILSTLLPEDPENIES